MLRRGDVHTTTRCVSLVSVPRRRVRCAVILWGARMALSRLRSRRGVLVMSLVAALSRVMPAKAQWTNGCEYGITNGLLTIGGDQCGIAVPGHMIDGTGTSLDNDSSTSSVGSFTDTRKEDRQDRLQNRRDQKRDKRYRRGNRRRDTQDRRHEREILCEDFSSQLQAVEALAQNPWAENKLDPDGDGVPCEHLRALTCDEFDDEAEAVNWFNRMGYTKAYDPFKLFDHETDSVCTERRTCDDFSTQKAAVEWLAHSPQDKKRLDPDNDGKACETLPVVTCKSFSTQADAKQWFNLVGFTKNNDPYGLWDVDTDSVCGKKVTCADFSTQKAAVEWLSQNPGDKAKLDPDNDGRPCENLTAVSCSQLGTQAAAKTWFDQNNFTPAFDPYDLYDDAEMKVCPGNG